MLLGLGAGKWENILWFLRHYPLDFTEVHVFEEKKGHFKKPPNSGVPKQYEVRAPPAGHVAFADKAWHRLAGSVWWTEVSCTPTSECNECRSSTAAVVKVIHSWII